MKFLSDLVNSIIRDGKVPKDWEESYLINLYKGKDDALSRENYRGFKLLQDVMKMSELAVEMQIRKSKGINDMQLEFIPGRGTRHAIFITRELQEKFLTRNKN